MGRQNHRMLPMQYGLYEYELEERVDELTASLAADQDDYIFAVTENSGHVAMVLIEKSGQVHINEQAREKLRALSCDVCKQYAALDPSVCQTTARRGITNQWCQNDWTVLTIPRRTTPCS